MLVELASQKDVLGCFRFQRAARHDAHVLGASHFGAEDDLPIGNHKIERERVREKQKCVVCEKAE